MSFIDEQVVKMRFDNDGFEKGVSDTISSLEKLNQSVENLGSGSASSALQSIQHSLDQINFTSLNNAIDAVNDRFSTMGVAAARVIENLTDKVETLAENLVNALSVKSLNIGFGEYEQVMDISKVILANTKASNEEVQNAVRDLQAYADRTIFNYNDLTGVFGNWVTMAGSLEKAGVSMETAMEGLGNMVAMSGKGTGEMSRLGYAMSKVFSQGYMNRMTMMQFMRNGAMSTEFQKAVTDAVKKVGDYEKYLRAMAASGQDLYGAVSSQTAKGDSNWFTDEVLIEVLRSYTDTSDVRGKNATAASEHVMTPSQLVSVTYEAMATGWSRVFESIFGDPEEARALLTHLSFILNGTDEVPGVLSGFFLNLGSFFEDWNMLGGRDDAISGLFDAFEGLQNIVESVGLVFAEFFPGFSPEGLAELTSNFKEGASWFKDWTENLRASFGDYTRWDFWMEEVHEQTPKEERIEADEDAIIATFLSEIQNRYGSDIKSIIEQYKDPKYVKTVKDNSEAGYHYALNETALNAAFKKYGYDSDEQKVATQFLRYWTGLDTLEELNDSFYEQGIKNDDHFNQLAKDTAEAQAYIALLKEVGVDGNELLQDIRDEMAITNTTYEDNRWFESHRKARVINQQEAGWEQQDFIDTLSGIFSVLGMIRDVATSLYDYVVEPMLTMITSGAFMSALEILSGIGSHLFEFYQKIVNSGALDTFFGTISDFIFSNIDIGGFFADLTVAFLQLNNIIWDTINNVIDFFGAISQNETFQTVIGYLHMLWDLIAPFISNNLKTGGAIGGFLGALKGALSGFFMGGPIGMLIGAFKGFTGGAVKGGMFGILIDVLQYLEKNGPKVKYILGQVYGIVSGLVGSFVSGFTESGLLGGFSEFVNQVKQLFTDIKTGAKDPLDAIFGFLNSETVRTGLDTAKTKVKEFGLWIANGLKWVKDHIITVYEDLMQKWQNFEGENTDNPIVKFVQFITDENSFVGQLLSLFTNKIGAFFEIFSALIDGLSEGSLSKAMDNLSDAKGEGSLKFWDDIFGVYYEWGTTFRSSDTFGIIKQGFYDLGSGIRSFISLVGNGTIPGIIFDIFSMVGKLGSSLINGIFGGKAPEQISEQAEQTGETVETGLKGIKQRLEAFINGEGFASLQQRLYDLGVMFDGFLGDTAEKFSEKFPDIAEGIGKFVDIITDTNFYKTLSNLKDIVVDIAASFISGFTGTELVRTGDDVATTLETINAALTEFKADDKYKTILDFFKDVGDFIAGIPEAIGKISENIGSIFKQDSVPGILFNGLASILIPKEPEVAKDVNGEIQDTGNSIIDSIISGAGGVAGGIWEAITSVFTGHEVSASELFPEETADAIEKATSEYKTSMDGAVAVTKEVEKQVSYGRDNQIEWQTGTATLKGAETVVEETTKVANEVNEKADETKEAAKNTQVFSNFGNGLNTFVHILGGLSTGAVVGGVIAIGVGLFSIFNAVGTITALLGNMNILIIVKLVNTVIVGLIAAIGSIMLLAYGLNKYQNGEIDKAVVIVQGLISFIGIVVLVMTLVNNLTNQGININVATNPFDALKALVSKIGDAINTMASKIGTFAIVAAIIGGVLLITNAIEKLSKLDEDKLKTAGDIVNATTMILGAVAVLLTIFASGGSNKEGINITANLNPAILAAPILMLAYSIKLIIDSYTELVKVLSDKNADPEAIKISAIAVGGIMTALGLLMAIFAFTNAPGNLTGGGLFETINNIKFDKFLTIGFALLAICEGVNLIIGAIGKLYNTVKNEKGTIDDSTIGFLAGAILSIALLILAMGQSMSLLGGNTGNSKISGGTSVAMIAMVLAVKGLIEAISDLANTYKEDMGNGVSIGNILGSIATIIALMFSTGGSIGLMKNSKINLGTSVAMIAMVWMIKELIVSIADLAKYYVANVNSWEDVAGLFGAIGTILGAMVALAGSMELMGDSSKKGAGIESAIAMIVMMISLWRIIETVKDLASDFNEGKIGNFILALGSIEAILWSLVGMVKLLTSTEIGITKTVNTESFWALAGIVLAAVGSLWFLAENIKDPDKLLPISESLAVIIGTFASVTWAAQKLGATGIAGGEAAVTGLNSMALVALKIGGVITAILGAIGLIGNMIDNHQKGEGIGSGSWGSEVATFFEGWGEGLLVAAEFIGKLAGKFREGYMVTDAETVADSMSAIGAGAEELSAAVESVSPENFLKIQKVLEAFDGFTTAMANFAVANGGVTLPTNMFENLGNDVKAFAPLFSEFCKEVAALDQTIESEYGIESFGSTTLTDYFNMITGLLSIEDTDAFDKEWGKSKFNGMKESFGDIKDGVIAFIEGCAAIDAKLSENKEKKADITSFDDYIQFVKDLAGIKFESYEGTGWFVDMGQNLETLGSGLTTFVGSVKGLEENEGFNNALDIMTKIKTTFGDTDSQNIYDSLTNVGLGLDAFVQSANDAFGKNIYGTSSYMDNDFITEKMERIQLLTDLFGNLAWAIETINTLDEDGANFILGLIGGIVSELAGVGEAGKETASTFIGGVEEEAVINSPSVAMFGIGVFLIQGLLNGIDAMQDPVESAGKSVFEIFANSFKESASNIGNLFGNAGTNLLKAFDKDGKVQNALSNVKTFFTKGIESGDFAKKLKSFNARYGKKDDHILGSGDHVYNGVSQAPRAIKKLNRKSQKIDTYKDIDLLNEQLEDSLKVGSKSMEDIEAQYEAEMAKAEEEWAKLEASMQTEQDMNEYEDWFGSEWLNKIVDARDTVTEYGQTAADGLQDFIGMFTGDGTDKKSFITSLKDGILEGIIPSYDELLSTDLINKYGINKIIGNELFDSFFNNSMFGGLFTDSNVLENILFSSEDLNGLLSNITEALPGLDLSSLSLDDLASELQVFSDNAHYMGGDETSNKLLKRVDSILGLLDEKGNYIGEAASGAVSELSDVSGMLGSSGITDFSGEEFTNLMEQYTSGAISADEFNEAVASMTKSSGDSTAAAVSGVNKAIDKMPQVDPKITEMAYRVIRGEFGNNPDRQGLLEAAGYSYEVIQNEVNRLLGNGFRYQTTQADIDRTLQALGGATEKQVTVEEILNDTTEALDVATKRLENSISEEQNKINKAVAEKLTQTGSVDRVMAMQLKRAGLDLNNEKLADAIESAVKEKGDYEKYSRAMAAANGNIIDAVSKSRVGADADWLTDKVFRNIGIQAIDKIVSDIKQKYGLNTTNNVDPHDLQIIKNIDNELPTTQELISDLMTDLNNANTHLDNKDYAITLERMKNVYDSAQKLAEENGMVFASTKTRKAMEEAKEISELADRGLAQIKETEQGSRSESLEQEIFGTRRDLNTMLNTTLSTLATEYPEMQDKLLESVNTIREYVDANNYKAAFTELDALGRKMNGKAVAMNTRDKHSFEQEFLRAESRIDSGDAFRSEGSLRNISKELSTMIYSLDDQSEGVLNKTKETEETIKNINDLTGKSSTWLNDAKDGLKTMRDMEMLNEHYHVDKQSNGWWQEETKKVEEGYLYTKRALSLLEEEYAKHGVEMETEAVKTGKAYSDKFTKMYEDANRLNDVTFESAEQQDNIVRNRVSMMKDELKSFADSCKTEYPRAANAAYKAISTIEDDNLAGIRDSFNTVNALLNSEVDSKISEYSDLHEKLKYIEDNMTMGRSDVALRAIEELNGQIDELSSSIFANIDEAEAKAASAAKVVAEVYDSVSGELISKIYDNGMEIYETFQGIEEPLGAPKYADAIMEIFDPETGELVSTIREGGIETFENSKSEVNEAAASAGEEAANSYIDGFTNAFLGSGDHISEIAHGEVVDKTNEKLGINSPSTEFFAMGEYCMMGFLNGFVKYLSNVQGVSGELSEAATSGLDEMQSYFAKLGDWMKSDAENPLDKFFTQFDNLYNMFTAMKDANGQPFTIHPKVAPVLEMDSQTADLGQLMTGQALLTVNGAQIAGIDRIYELLERSINSSKDDSHAIITAIDSTREELGTLKNAINGMQVTLDKKKLVGEIYTDINRMMGIDKNRAARGI